MWQFRLSALNLVKISCLILLLVSYGESVPMPQYDTNDYIEEEYEEEEIQEEPEQNVGIPEPVDFGPQPQPATAPGGPPSPAAAFKLPENYSVHKSPPLINGTEPIPVEFSMLVFNVFDIKEIQEEISMEVNYKLSWRDTRLMNWTLNVEPGQKFVVLSPTLLHRLWHPDIFIDHIKRVTQPTLISSAASLRIYPDASLRYTARMLIVLTCRMDFHYYPADTQQCNVTMKSFAFSTKHITLSWKDGIGALLAKSIDVHNFDVALETHPDYLQQTKSNNYSALSFSVRLRRKLSYHIIQTYVPSTLFTIVSWLSFLVPPDSTPGRMAICVTTLLTVTAMFGSVKQNTPNVSYIKALDVWMFMCIVFIFMSLAEFTVVLKLRSKKPKKLKPKKPKKPRPRVHKKSNVNNVSLDFQVKNVIPPPAPAPAPVAASTPGPPAPGAPTPPPPAKNNDVESNTKADCSEENLKNVISLPVTPKPVYINNLSLDEKKNVIPSSMETGGTGGGAGSAPVVPASPPPVVTPPPAAAPAPAGPPKPTPYALSAAKIEKYAPRILPCMFVMFTSIYWPYLLIASEYYSLSMDPDMYYTV